jgi:hypothetical protein
METIRPTRFPGLGYRDDGHGWRFYDASTGSAIGGVYCTRAELLADAQRFAEERGFADRPDLVRLGPAQAAQVRTALAAHANMQDCEGCREAWALLGDGPESKGADPREALRRILEYVAPFASAERVGTRHATSADRIAAMAREGLS